MKYVVTILFLLAGLLLSSCASGAAQVIALSPQTYQPGEARLVKIDVNTGNVLITASPDGNIHVSGMVTTDSALTYKVEQNSTGFVLFSQYPKRIFPLPAPDPVNLEIQIPIGFKVQFNTQEANLVVKNYVGNLDLMSVAGDATVEGLRGVASIKANRGDVSLRASQGELHVAGNYGLLALDDLHGQVDASTIMGTIRYQGLPDRDDRIHFESDHGPVEINLSGKPDLLVKVHSTSGDVICLFPALERDTRNCLGTLGDGSAQLTVRTVSGAITFQPTAGTGITPQAP